MLLAMPSGQFQMFCRTCRPTHSAPRTAPAASTQSIPVQKACQSMLASKELIHRVDEHGRLIYEGHVSALREDDQLGASDLRLHLFGHARVALIMIADED